MIPRIFHLQKVVAELVPLTLKTYAFDGFIWTRFIDTGKPAVSTVAFASEIINLTCNPPKYGAFHHPLGREKFNFEETASVLSDKITKSNNDHSNSLVSRGAKYHIENTPVRANDCVALGSNSPSVIVLTAIEIG